MRGKRIFTVFIGISVMAAQKCGFILILLLGRGSSAVPVLQWQDEIHGENILAFL